MSAEFVPLVFAEFDESAELELDEVLALQALVMGHVRQMALQKGRKVHVGGEPRTHAYSLLDNSGDDIFSGDKDQYLGVRVRRIGFRAWSMGISVLENDMTKARYRSSLRTRYQLRWNNDIALGRIVEDLRKGPEYKEDEGIKDVRFLATGDTHAVRLITPMATDDLDIIAARSLEVAAGATSRMNQFLDRFTPSHDDNST
jgi:hypothetical protein